MSAQLRVVVPGPLTLVVDGGRSGVARLGMPSGGAADPVALALALALAGAPADAAALEGTVRGPTLLVVAGTPTVAAVGAPLTRIRAARREPLAPWRGHRLAPGDTVEVGAAAPGVRVVVALGGGIDVPPRLGSRSTSLRGGLDGLLARALVAGDTVDLLDEGGRPRGGDGDVLGPMVAPLAALRILPGPQLDRLRGGIEALAGPWRVGSAGDRVGIRLDGAPLRLLGGADVPSQGCPLGAIQVPGDGHPVLLGVDRGTLGGYAMPAVVAAADTPGLGRLRPGQPLRLEPVDAAGAATAVAGARRHLAAALAGLEPVAGT